MTKTSFNLIIKLFNGSLNKTLLLALVGMFVVYSFFIARAVIAVNERKALYADLRTSQAKVSELEIKYFNLASAVDVEKAATLGFIESKNPTFAYTRPAVDTAVAVR